MQKHYNEKFSSGKELLDFLNKLNGRKEVITSIVRIKTLEDDREYIITTTLPTVSYANMLNFARYVRDKDKISHVCGDDLSTLEDLLADYTKIP